MGRTAESKRRHRRMFEWVAAVLVACFAALPRPISRVDTRDLTLETYPGERRVVADLFDPALAGKLLEDPYRDRWQKPGRLVEALGLRPGQTVADIGAGSGYLLPWLSRAVGTGGTVYAEEIQTEFLPALKRRAARLGNVRPVLGTPTDPRIPAGRADMFVMLTVYHEIKDPVPFLRILRGLAKSSTRMAVIDFDGDRKGDYPAPIEHEVPTEAVVAEASKAGWALEARHEFLGSQFFLIFRPK